MNLPADPCNTGPDNRFHDCIRRKVSGQVSPKEIFFWWKYLSRWDVGPSGIGGVARIFQVAQRRNNSGETCPLAILFTIHRPLSVIFREYQKIFNQLAAADVERITELTGCLRLVRHNVTFAVQCDLKDFLCVSKLFVIMRPERHNFTFGVKFDLKNFLCLLKILDIMQLCPRPCKYRKYSMVGEGFPSASQSF